VSNESNVPGVGIGRKRFSMGIIAVLNYDDKSQVTDWVIHGVTVTHHHNRAGLEPSQVVLIPHGPG
jgi:hypothetical protein